MTARFAAAALFAFAGLTATAQAAPSCSVTVMGMTFDQCRTDTLAATAPRAGEAPAFERAAPSAAYTTGSIARRSAAR